jgi:protocatechuate 3,4-dioxygenase beta subunit
MDIKHRIYHEAPYYDENRSFRVQVLDKYGEPVRRARVEWYIGNGYYAETLDDNNAQSSPGKYRTWQSNWAGNMKGWQYNPTTYYPDGNVRSWGFWYESSGSSNSKNLQLDRWPDHQMDMIFIAYRSRKVL